MTTVISSGQLKILIDALEFAMDSVHDANYPVFLDFAHTVDYSTSDGHMYRTMEYSDAEQEAAFTAASNLMKELEALNIYTDYITITA